MYMMAVDGRTSPSPLEGARPLRILVVEDEVLIAMDIGMTLEDAGYEVVGTARTAPEAVALASEHLPDLVLMDLHLAEGTHGDDAAREILELHGIRSIFVSGSIDDARHAGLADLEPLALLVKPVQPAVLLKAVAAS